MNKILDEMVFVLKRMKINHVIDNFTKFDIFQRYYYHIDQDIASKYIDSGQVYEICKQFDLIIIGDTIPLGRPFYQATPHICKSKLALQITNRFNHEIRDKKSYLKLMRYLVDNPNVFWIPNNDFELLFLNINGIYPKIERTLLIRPFGISEQIGLPVKQKKTIVYSVILINYIRNYLANSNLAKDSYTFFSDKKYGGPLTLKNHKIFVYFPYQFSTMKVFQNSNYGVVMAIPSPNFYKEFVMLAKKKHGCGYIVCEALWLFQNYKNWTEYFDVYNSNYIDMHIKFNSWPELIELINNKEIDSKRKIHSDIIGQKMNWHWKDNEQKWSKFFNLIF
jgi:hypothetical protein